jgi:hypothetical protein
MMTDYNDGEWHGWNGDFRPDAIHPKSVIEYVWHEVNRQKSGVSILEAGRRGEEGSPAWSQVIRFRVITPYTGPRECFAVGAHLFDTREDAQSFLVRLDDSNPGKGYGKQPITKWREVTE